MKLLRLVLVPLFLTVLATASAATPSPASPPPAGVALLGADITVFKPGIYVADKSTARIESVTVQGRAFTQALRLTALAPSSDAWKLGVNFPTIAPVKKGDILWVTFESRRIKSLKESGEAVATATFMMKNEAGKEVRPLEQGFSCGLDWVTTSIPFVASDDAPFGGATLALRFGAATQSLEVGGLRLINCGPRADLATLPRTTATYEGSAPDAAWRTEAFARIEKLRKGDLALRVVDAAGKPVAGATVAVRMKRHAFAWGTAVDAKRIVTGNSPDDLRYRETIENHFNKVVFENDLKWPRWISSEPRWGKAYALEALTWFEARDIPVRGHVMVWPSWRQTPKQVFTPEVKKDPAAVKQAVLAHIDDQTSILKGRLAEWDVINETYAHHDIMDLVGRDVMIDWFKRARAGDPKTKLFYNDYTMFQGTTPDSASQHFYDTVKFLKDGGAPIDAIGEQAHFGGTPPGPPQLLATLDKFAQLGLPIQFSEFDIDTPDEKLQAAFMRDFTIVAFSHPAVSGVVQWGFWACSSWIPNCALWDKNWNLRPHGHAWVDLVTKTWWTNADGRSAANGTYATRGFYGDYEVTVTRAGRSETVRLKLKPGAAEQTITLGATASSNSPAVAPALGTLSLRHQSENR